MPISEIKDLLDIFDRVAEHREVLARAVEFSRSRYFYHEDLVKHLLWRRD